MNLPSVYSRIVDSPDIVEALSWPFEFEVCDPYLLSSELPVTLSEELVVLAQDDAGGAYSIIEHIEPEDSPVIYVSSEGAAGRVGSGFNEFLEILIAMPYWKDVLKFSDNGNLQEMRKAAQYLEKEILEFESDIDDKRAQLYKALELSPLSDPIQNLYNSVKVGPSIEIKDSDGTSYDGLFNTFKVSDNPSWKG